MSPSKRTVIKDISPVGDELSDEQLRLVSGGAINCGTKPASITMPNEPDNATDETSSRIDSCV